MGIKISNLLNFSNFTSIKCFYTFRTKDCNPTTFIFFLSKKFCAKNGDHFKIQFLKSENIIFQKTSGTIAISGALACMTTSMLLLLEETHINKLPQNRPGKYTSNPFAQAWSKSASPTWKTIKIKCCTFANRGGRCRNHYILNPLFTWLLIFNKSHFGRILWDRQD